MVPVRFRYITETRRFTRCLRENSEVNEIMVRAVDRCTPTIDPPVGHELVSFSVGNCQINNVLPSTVVEGRGVTSVFPGEVLTCQIIQQFITSTFVAYDWTIPALVMGVGIRSNYKLIRARLCFLA